MRFLRPRKVDQQIKYHNNSSTFFSSCHHFLEVLDIPKSHKRMHCVGIGTKHKKDLWSNLFCNESESE